MRRKHNQRTITHQISNRTIYPRLVGGEAWNPSPILLIFGVTKEYHAPGLVLQRSAKSGDSVRHNGCTLTVATSYDGGAGALLGSEVEEALGFADGGLGCAGREGVV